MTSPKPNRMPPASASLIFTGVTIAAGRAISNQPVVTPKLVTAGAFLLISVTVINSVDASFASVLSLLIFIAVFLQYGGSILTYLGFTLQSGADDGTA